MREKGFSPITKAEKNRIINNNEIKHIVAPQNPGPSSFEGGATSLTKIKFGKRASKFLRLFSKSDLFCMAFRLASGSERPKPDVFLAKNMR